MTSAIRLALTAVAACAATCPAAAERLYLPDTVYAQTYSCNYEWEDKPVERTYIDEDDNQSYSRTLASAREPRIAPRPGRSLRAGQEIIRLVVKRTFANPVVVRVERADKGARLIAKRLDGLGGYWAGNLKVRKIVKLDEAQTAAVQAAFAALSFEPNPANRCPITTDGSNWLVEHATGDQYRVINARGPEGNDEALWNFGNLLLALTGWELGQIY